MMRMQQCLVAVTTILLLGFGASHPGPGIEGERRLHVIYHAPKVSVEAQGVSVQEVLRAIGTHVGFAVVHVGGSGLPLTVSIKDATLEEVLQRLLRTENYAVVYRAQGRESADPVIDTLFLLGPSASAAVTPGDEGTDADPPAPRVEELLESYALASLEGLSAETPPKPSSAPTDHRSIGADQTYREGLTNIDEILAITTRLAQRNLQVLLDGLTTATDSLLETQGARGR